MKKNVYLWYVPFAILVALLSGCVTSAVVTESNAVMAPDASLEGAKSFSWAQPVAVSPADYDKDFTGELDANLRRAIEEDLKQKGLQLVPLKPDLLVAYDVSVEVPQEKDQVQNYMEGFGYGYAYMAGYRYNYTNSDMMGYRPVDLYKQGTLIIDVIDPATNRLLWRGWAEEAISDPEARYSRIQEQVKEVLKKLEL